MAKFRTNSGLIDCTPMMRTTSGITACTVVVYTTGGPIAGGGSLNASVSSDEADGSIYRKTPNSVTTATVTASATGGTTPYAYAWLINDAGWKITSPTAATTAFQSPTLQAGDSAATAARCVVTDTNGLTATTPNVQVTACNNYEVS